GHTHDPGPRAGAASAGTTPGPPGTQQDPLARELALGQRVDPGVDRLVRHRVGHPLSVLTAVFVAQPARDLIRGVPRPEPRDHLRAQHRIGVELAGLGPTPRAGGRPGGPGRPVALPTTMTGDLPTHHAGVPPDPRRDHHTLDALGDPPGDLLPVRPGHHEGRGHAETIAPSW